jgi:ComF family protein
MTPRGIGGQLLDLLFPPRCQCCGEFSADPICETCAGQIEFIDERLCPCCGTFLRHTGLESRPGGLCSDCRDGRLISGARAAGLHAYTLRQAIIKYKFHDRRQLAPTFAEMLADLVDVEVDPRTGPGLPLERCEALVPVPLHPRRRAWRGFDQAELLCRELAERLQMPMWTDTLARIRETRPQTQLKGASRRTNVRGAFEARKPWRLQDRAFILVDDVFTTGATLDECALVLKQAGAAAVYGLTVSRAVPRWHPAALGLAEAAPTGDTNDA